MRFEYKSVVYPVERRSPFNLSSDTDTCRNIESRLNRMGEEGWELAGVIPLIEGSPGSQVTRAIHHFKRAVPDA